MNVLLLAEALVNEIASRHGQLISITSDKDDRFGLKSWKTLHESMGTKIQFRVVDTKEKELKT